MSLVGIEKPKRSRVYTSANLIVEDTKTKALRAYMKQKSEEDKKKYALVSTENIFDNNFTLLADAELIRKNFLKNLSELAENENITRVIENIIFGFIKHMSEQPDFIQIKQITVRKNDDVYIVSFGWPISPNFTLSVKKLNAYTQCIPQILDIRLNVSGSCCVKQSNLLMGISTPCQCDNGCFYELDGKDRKFNRFYFTINPSLI